MSDLPMDDSAPPPSPQPLAPPAMIGILGGGPTARYLQHVAQQMGYGTRVLDPDLSPDLLVNAAAQCSVVTVVDQLPVAAMRVVAGKTAIHPSPNVVELCMDRIRVKQFLGDLGVAVSPFMLIETDDDIATAAGTKFSAILKPRHHGAGRTGQVRVASHANLLEAWEALGRSTTVLEQRITIARELAITVVRSPSGRVATYAVSQQQYVHGKLEISYAPASLLGSGQADAAELGAYIAAELGIVGVLTVHMFVVGRDVFVHELIPRPSALGLFTLDGCRTNQYEQQLRAVCDLALAETAMTVTGIALVNLPGELWANGEPKWERILTDGTVHLHRYDAIEPTEGAIAGHLAACSGTAAGSTSVVRRLRKELTTG